MFWKPKEEPKFEGALPRGMIDDYISGTQDIRNLKAYLLREILYYKELCQAPQTPGSIGDASRCIERNSIEGCSLKFDVTGDDLSSLALELYLDGSTKCYAKIPYLLEGNAGLDLHTVHLAIDYALKEPDSRLAALVENELSAFPEACAVVSDSGEIAVHFEAPELRYDLTNGWDHSEFGATIDLRFEEIPEFFKFVRTIHKERTP